MDCFWIKTNCSNAGFLSVTFSFTMWNYKLCRFPDTNTHISDSTNSGGQMSCDQVVTNLFWHQWADVMFNYPMETLQCSIPQFEKGKRSVEADLFWVWSLRNGRPYWFNCNPVCSFLKSSLLSEMDLWRVWIMACACLCPWALHQNVNSLTIWSGCVPPKIIAWLRMASILRVDGNQMLITPFCPSRRRF